MGKCPHSGQPPPYHSPSICTLTLGPELPGTPGKPTEIRQSTKRSEGSRPQGWQLRPLLIAPKSWNYPRYSPAGRPAAPGGRGPWSPGLPGASTLTLGAITDPVKDAASIRTLRPQEGVGSRMQGWAQRSETAEDANTHFSSRGAESPSLLRKTRLLQTRPQSEPEETPSEGNSPSSRLLQGRGFSLQAEGIHQINRVKNCPCVLLLANPVCLRSRVAVCMSECGYQCICRDVATCPLRALAVCPTPPQRSRAALGPWHARVRVWLRGLCLCPQCP